MDVTNITHILTSFTTCSDTCKEANMKIETCGRRNQYYNKSHKYI